MSIITTYQTWYLHVCFSSYFYRNLRDSLLCSLLDIDIAILNRKFCPGRKGIMRLTICEAPIGETRPDHNTGKFSLPWVLIPRRLNNHLTTCRCNYKESTFSSVILNLKCWTSLGLKPSTSHKAACSSTN